MMKLSRYTCLTLPICLAAACSVGPEPGDQTQVGQAPAAPAENPSPATAPKPITPPVAQSGSASPEAGVGYFKEGEGTAGSSGPPPVGPTAGWCCAGDALLLTVSASYDAA